jgi:cysteine desulfurase
MPDVITYLDHAATTPLRAEVAEAMAAAQREPLGNPTGSHRPAQRARRLLEEARDEIAECLGRRPQEIIFTSGGTEAANLAVLGTVSPALRAGCTPVILCSAIEHPAVRQSCRAAEAFGAKVAELPVDGAGRVDMAAVGRSMHEDVAVVAVMAANNETGVVQPITGLVRVVRASSDSAHIFTDAVQAAPFLDVAALTAGADMVGLSAHKLGGPVGVGILAVSPSVELSAQMHGGGQEQERRSGTQNVVGAVGMAAALRLAEKEREIAGARVALLRDRLASALVQSVSDLHVTVPVGTEVLPGHLHLCFGGIEREELLLLLGERGVCASGGSSCASGALEPSPVLLAMGLPDELARGAIRFSLGYDNSDADVEQAASVVPEAVAQLRHGR